MCGGLRLSVLSTAELEDDNCRIVHQPATYGGSYIEKLTDKTKPLNPTKGSKWQKVFGRGNKYQVPVWVTPTKNSFAALSETAKNGVGRR